MQGLTTKNKQNSPQYGCLVKDFSDIYNMVLHFLCSFMHISLRETGFLRVLLLSFAAEGCALHARIQARPRVQEVAGLH